MTVVGCDLAAWGRDEQRILRLDRAAQRAPTVCFTLCKEGPEQTPVPRSLRGEHPTASGTEDSPGPPNALSGVSFLSALSRMKREGGDTRIVPLKGS